VCVEVGGQRLRMRERVCLCGRQGERLGGSVFLCVLDGEKERERNLCVCVCVCARVFVSDMGVTAAFPLTDTKACMCVCVWGGESE